MTRPARPRLARLWIGFDALESRTLLSVADPSREIIVRFDEALPAARQAALLHAIRGTVVQSFGDGPSLVALGRGITPDHALAQLDTSRGVRYAERADTTVHASSVTPSDPLFNQQWYLNNPDGVDIDAPAAWGTTTGSSSTIVAVIDTGIVLSHPEFAGRLWTGPKGIHGWNFLNNTANLQDSNGHGTHVAGLLGASANNGAGIAGVNWSAQLMILKALDNSGEGTIPSVVAAIHYAVDHGAKVINASWDIDQYDPALADAINYAAQHNVVVVVAAGNESANDDTTRTFPASLRSPNVLSVAAVDQQGRLASFSNYGVGTVAIAAPGVGILSTYLGNGYTYLDGTSMSTPLVAGVVALVAGLHPNDTASQLVQAVTATARPDPYLAGLISSGGIVDAAAAVNYGTTTIASVPTPSARPTTDAVHAQLLSVPEFYDQAGDTDAGFVNRLYQSLLGRDAEPAGLNGWVTQLQKGATREQVATALESTTEALQTEVARWYQTDLGRTATLANLKTDSGVQSWVARLQQGMSVTIVHAQLLSVPEFYDQAGDTDAGFVNRLYQSLLGRDAELAGLNGWVTQLQKGATRQQVAIALESTTEALQTEVARWYQTDLGRTVTLANLKADSGVQSWVSQLS